MSATLFVLTSPLQATHAAHYAVHVDLDPGTCWVAFVKSRLEPDNNLTRAVLAEKGFVNVREFEPLLPAGGAPLTAEGKAHAAAINDYDAFSSRRSFRLRVDQFFDGLNLVFDRVVLGDYRPVSYRQFLARVDLEQIDCVLLDDGAVSQAVMAFRENKHSADEVFRAKPFASKTIDAPDPLAYLDPSRLTFFSIYDGRLADGDVILRNAHYGDVFKDAAPAIRDEIWIVGCNHVENGIAHEAEYLQICLQARRLAPEKRCVYFPHRREDQGKVQRTASAIGADIRLTGGIEDAIAAGREAPSVLASFGSTVLDTVSRMAGRSIACVLVVPPPAYFLGPRRAHIEAVIRGNVRGNADVVGLFADDSFAADRFEASAILRGEDVPAVFVAPASGCAMGGVAPGHLDGFHQSPSRDGGMLLLETAKHGLHRFQIASIVLPRGGSAFVAFRIAGEGRSTVRLRVMSEADESVHADCDLDLDAGGFAESANDGVSLSAAVHVDERRRAVVRLIASVAVGGRYRVQVITRPNDAARSSLMPGNPDIGVSLPPQLESQGAAIALDGGRTPAVLQVAMAENAIGVMRLTLDGRAFDLVLRPSSKHAKAAPTSSWGLLACEPSDGSALLRRSTPVVAERNGSRLVLRTAIDRIEVPLAAPDAAVAVDVLDPYTGERRVIEVAVGLDRPDPATCYVVAY